MGALFCSIGPIVHHIWDLMSAIEAVVKLKNTLRSSWKKYLWLASFRAGLKVFSPKCPSIAMPLDMVTINA